MIKDNRSGVRESPIMGGGGSVRVVSMNQGIEVSAAIVPRNRSVIRRPIGRIRLAKSRKKSLGEIIKERVVFGEHVWFVLKFFRFYAENSTNLRNRLKIGMPVHYGGDGTGRCRPCCTRP